MNTPMELGAVSIETKGTFCIGKFVDGAKSMNCGGAGGFWFYRTSDYDPTQPMRPAPVG